MTTNEQKPQETAVQKGTYDKIAELRQLQAEAQLGGTLYTGDTPHGLKPQRLLTPRDSLFPEQAGRRPSSIGTVVARGNRKRAQPTLSDRSGRCHARCRSHAHPKELVGSQLGLRRLGEQQHLKIALPFPLLEELEAFPRR